jgi:L-seryl-tRNA(Ser) seleniumtransferase
LGEGGEVIASRGEQVEIGGAFRIPDVMAKSGAHLREVGTTNRTRIKDYEKAISEHTRLLLRVHPSNFRMIGFTERPSLEEFVDLGKRRNIPTFEDLGSGCMIDIEALGVRDEPVAAASIEAGVDIICFSGDKLLGGPQAGIIAGKKLYVEKVRQNPLFRALRVDKLTISVLEYVVRAYLEGRVDDIPIWKMLRNSESELKQRAERFAASAGSIAKPVHLTSLIGGGSAPESYLPSWGVALQIPGLSESELERRLRSSSPPVIARVENDRVILDFRTVFPHDEDEILEALQPLRR